MYVSYEVGTRQSSHEQMKVDLKTRLRLPAIHIHLKSLPQARGCSGLGEHISCFVTWVDVPSVQQLSEYILRRSDSGMCANLVGSLPLDLGSTMPPNSFYKSEVVHGEVDPYGMKNKWSALMWKKGRVT